MKRILFSALVVAGMALATGCAKPHDTPPESKQASGLDSVSSNPSEAMASSAIPGFSAVNPGSAALTVAQFLQGIWGNDCRAGNPYVSAAGGYAANPTLFQQVQYRFSGQDVTIIVQDFNDYKCSNPHSLLLLMRGTYAVGNPLPESGFGDARNVSFTYTQCGVYNTAGRNQVCFAESRTLQAQPDGEIAIGYQNQCNGVAEFNFNRSVFSKANVRSPDAPFTPGSGNYSASMQPIGNGLPGGY